MTTKQKYLLLFLLLIIVFLISGCWNSTKEQLAKCNGSLDTCKNERDTFKGQADDYKTKYDTTRGAFDVYKEQAEKKETLLNDKLTEKEANLTTCEADKNKCEGAINELRSIKSYLWAGLLFELAINIGFLILGKYMEWIEIETPALWIFVGICVIFGGVLEPIPIGLNNSLFLF